MLKKQLRRGLSAFFYDVGYKEGQNFKSYEEMLNFIKEKGLPMDALYKVCRQSRGCKKIYRRN